MNDKIKSYGFNSGIGLQDNAIDPWVAYEIPMRSPVTPLDDGRCVWSGTEGLQDLVAPSTLDLVGRSGLGTTLIGFTPTEPPPVSIASTAPTDALFFQVVICGETLPPWLRYVTRRLTDMARLWEEPDSDLPVPEPMAFRRSLSEIHRVMRDDLPAPSVIATVDGNILFTWRQPHSTVEIEVGPERTEVWAERLDGPERIEGDLVDWQHEVGNFLDPAGR